jgi:hypothetical protein
MAERMNFAEADSRQRHQSHVKAVKKRPAFNERKTKGADENGGSKEPSDEDEAS